MSDAKNIQYLQKLRSLLLMEYEAEKEDFRLQSEKMPLARKVRRGICWHPVSVGRSYYNSLNQLVVEVFRQGEDDEIEHNFQFGYVYLILHVSVRTLVRQYQRQLPG